MKPTVISQDTPWGEIPSLLLPAYGETWLMVAIVMLFVVTLGGLVGVVLFNASPRGLFPHALLYRLLNWVVNMGRSLPFLVLMAAIIPFTYWLTGTTIGIPAAVVPMMACASSDLPEPCVCQTMPPRRRPASSSCLTRATISRIAKNCW